MKYLSIIFLTISLLLAVSCAGRDVKSVPAVPEFKQEIVIINNSPISAVIYLNRMFCKLENYKNTGKTAYIRECPKAVATMESGEVMVYDVTNAQEYCFTIRDDQDVFYYYMTILPTSQFNRARLEYDPILIEIKIGVPGKAKIYLKDLFKMKVIA